MYVYAKYDSDECSHNNNPEPRPDISHFTRETLCAAPDKSQMSVNGSPASSPSFWAVSCTVFHFTFPFPSSMFCNQYYQHPSGKLCSFRRESGNTFIACQLFFLTPMKEDMGKFSTDTVCCNQLKFNLQIVQTHPISFMMIQKLKKPLHGNFQCLPHSGTVWMI